MPEWPFLEELKTEREPEGALWGTLILLSSLSNPDDWWNPPERLSNKEMSGQQYYVGKNFYDNIKFRVMS